jgi:predicted metal-dependent HD superfamily phosphohydrolase
MVTRCDLQADLIDQLELFLNRETLYGSEHLRSRYEQQARKNLQRAIDRLRK